MYLEHFKFKQLPFTLTPNTEFFCNLPGHQGALNVLLFSLRQGEGFVKIVGDVGVGKTLLCRVLLDTYKDEFFTAYIPNPDLTPAGLRSVLAQELGIPQPHPESQHQLLELIVQRLVELNSQNKRVVLLLDEAQALPLEGLEAVRLLTNLETNTSKLLQVVLFGQNELDDRLNKNSLRQLKQRITFSYYLAPLNRNEVDDYLSHRCMMAGYTSRQLFSEKARNLLYQHSQGIPRLINIYCHKALLVAYGRGQTQVDHKAMRFAITDTRAKNTKKAKIIEGCAIAFAAVMVIIAIALTVYRYG